MPVLTSRNADSEVYRLVASMVRVVQVERLHINAGAGWGDPAGTSHLFGHLSSFVYGAGVADVCVRPVALLSPFVRFEWHILGPKQLVRFIQ
jgi:hypothetical protein